MDTSDVPESSSTNIKFDDIWVHSIIWPFEWNFDALRVGKCYSKGWETSGYFGTFNLELTKISSTAFEVALNRNSENISMPSDDGCYLECNISVFGGDKPRTVPMRFEEYRVSSIFQYDEIHNARKNTEICCLLCVIKMFETSVLSNEEHRKQNESIENLKTNDNAAIMEDMAFLLKRESLANIFTGRQSSDFATLKTGMIARTLPFAHEIANKVRYKQRNIKYEPHTSPQVYLGYIFDKDVEQINEEQLFKLHMNAHVCGLTYLVNECIDFMLFKAEAKPVELVRIFTLAEITLDSELSSKASITLLENREKMRKTGTWNYFLKHEQITRFILDSIWRNFNVEGNRVFGGRIKVDKRNSKRELTIPILHQAGKDREDAKQHSGEKQNTDKESNTQQSSTEESGGTTEDVDMEEAGACSNMERYLNGSPSSSKGEKMECSSAHEKYAMASSNPDRRK